MNPRESGMPRWVVTVENEDGPHTWTLTLDRPADVNSHEAINDALSAASALSLLETDTGKVTVTLR